MSPSPLEWSSRRIARTEPHQKYFESSFEGKKSIYRQPKQPCHQRCPLSVSLLAEVRRRGQQHTDPSGDLPLCRSCRRLFCKGVKRFRVRACTKVLRVVTPPAIYRDKTLTKKLLGGCGCDVSAWYAEPNSFALNSSRAPCEEAATWTKRLSN